MRTLRLDNARRKQIGERLRSGIKSERDLTEIISEGIPHCKR